MTTRSAQPASPFSFADRARLRVAVVGCGHWGPNHIRVFEESDRAQVVACADLNAIRLQRIKTRFPHIETTTNSDALLSDPRIDAVVIATPTATHFSLASAALRAGKHVLVEKPLCTTADQVTQLETIAAEVGRVLMVGHVFVFNGGILKLKELIDGGQLGRVQYLDAVRTNLGPVRGDVNALFDLGTHDISIFNFLLGATPTAVAAHGRCISQRSIEDVCFATLQYPDGTLAHLHVSWLNPRKVRTLTVVGSSKMAHWDDVDPQDTLRIYDKGLDEPPYYDSFGEFQYLLRSADVNVPAIRRMEPLSKQAEAFIAWALDGKPCAADATAGAAVVRTLEAAMISMRNGGAMVSLDDTDAPRTRIIASAQALIDDRKSRNRTTESDPLILSGENAV